MSKFKPYLIIAVVALVSVWAFNKFISPKTGMSLG